MKENNIEIKKSASDNMTVVFDIDGVLTDHNIRDKETRLFFLRKGAILYPANTTHYIFPGILELMRLLFSTENIKVSFFSSGEKRRNVPFVEMLLKTALGEE